MFTQTYFLVVGVRCIDLFIWNICFLRLNNSNIAFINRKGGRKNSEHLQNSNQRTTPLLKVFIIKKNLQIRLCFI
jgi:hypothetical protein